MNIYDRATSRFAVKLRSNLDRSNDILGRAAICLLGLVGICSGCLAFSTLSAQTTFTYYSGNSMAPSAATNGLVNQSNPYTPLNTGTYTPFLAPYEGGYGPQLAPGTSAWTSVAQQGGGYGFLNTGYAIGIGPNGTGSFSFSDPESGLSGSGADSPSTTLFQQVSVGALLSMNDALGDVAAGVGQSAGALNWKQPALSLQGMNIQPSQGIVGGDLTSHSSELYSYVGQGNTNAVTGASGYGGPFSSQDWTNQHDRFAGLMTGYTSGSNYGPLGSTFDQLQTTAATETQSVMAVALSLQNGGATDITQSRSAITIPYLDLTGGMSVHGMNSQSVKGYSVTMPEDSVGDYALVRSGITLFIYLALYLYYFDRVRGWITGA